MATIAFIGLGNMGSPMAANLIKAQHDVRVYDLSHNARARLAEHGATATGSPSDAAQGADAVITMLPAGSHVRETYLGEGGVISAASPGTLLIDCSTIDVVTARSVIAAASDAGLPMVDAPVSGGVGGAQAGTLTFMAGGQKEAFSRAEPILKAMGKTVIYAGAAGNGQAAKICNNMILGISMIGVCEAFVLAEKLGLSAQTLFDIASTASGQCWSLTSYCPVPGPVPGSPANRGYAPGFSSAMMLKDLKLAQEASRGSGANTPMGAEAASLYGLFVAHGNENVDFSSIIQFLRGVNPRENKRI
jgi:3-hydroxyisobutyrate dehydrogenase